MNNNLRTILRLIDIKEELKNVNEIKIAEQIQICICDLEYLNEKEKEVLKNE